MTRARRGTRRTSVVAIVPAAGAGRRAGGSSSKLFRSLRGTPVLARTLQRLSRVAAITQIIVVTRRSELAHVRRLVTRYRLRKVQRVVIGGTTRMESVRRGIAAVNGCGDYLAIHDAARPLIAPRLVTAAIRAAQRAGAAIVAAPATDTIKIQSSGGQRASRLRTPPRQSLWIAQTPQVFARDLIERAYAAARRARVTVTDDAAAVERLGHRVALVPGDAGNLKLTWPADFVVAEALLQRSA